MDSPELLQASDHSPALVLDRSWLMPLVGLSLVLLAISGVVWYRKSKANQKRVTFHGVREDPVPELTEVSELVQTAQPIPEQTTKNEQVLKTPVVEEENSLSLLPPEYEMLEEADIYLRFGHDKLAEEVLKDAMQVNPKNPQTFMRLLRIYFTREEKSSFIELAEQFKSFGDESDWSKVAEMGRNLAPNSELFL
jgi:Tfp pilus assembly protein FimV